MNQRLLPEAPAPKKMSPGKKWLIWGVTAAVVFVVLTIVTVNTILSGITNAAVKELPPAPGTNNVAPAVPGQTPTPSAIPVPEWRSGRGIDTHKFTTDGGKPFQTHKELVAAIKVPVAEYPDTISAQTRFYELMEQRVNYEPTEEEARNNLNIPAGQQLEIDDYRDAAKLYRDTYVGLFEVESGGLFKFMDQLGSDVYDIQIANYGTSVNWVPKVSYEVNVEFARTRPEFIVTDNVAKTELVTGTPGLKAVDVTGFITGTYELTFTGFGPDKVTENKEQVWKFGEKVVVTKKPAV